MSYLTPGPAVNTKVQLDFAASTDLFSGGTIPATTWTDLTSNQTFTVDDSNSVVEIEVAGSCRSTGGNYMSTRLVIDSAGTPINKMLGAADTPTGTYGNVLAGDGTVVLTGLSAGSHTVKIQLYCNAGTSGAIYCRCATQPNSEFVNIRVLERKQSSSPPSSTPAPAVSAYNSSNITLTTATEATVTFDTTRYDQGTGTPQHSTSTNTGRLTCQQAGVYAITGTAEFASNATGERYLAIRLNGATDLQYETRGAVSGDTTDMCISRQYYLNVGDYVELRAMQSSGGNLNISATSTKPEFMMVRVDTGGTGAIYTPQTKTANYAVTAVDGMLVAGASGLTFTLPAASGYGGKAPLVVKNGAFTATSITPAGSDTIDGASSYLLQGQYQSVSLVADPAAGAWWAI